MDLKEYPKRNRVNRFSVSHSKTSRDCIPTDSTSIQPDDNGKLVTESGLAEEHGLKESPIISEENSMHNDEHGWLSSPQYFVNLLLCVTFLDDGDNIGYYLNYIVEIPAWFKDSMVLINFMHTYILLTRIIYHQECPPKLAGY